MNIMINGTDKSAFATKYGCREVPRRVYGPNQGVSKAGSTIVDFLVTKYDLIMELAPIRSEDLAWFASLLNNEYVTVTYFSEIRNVTVTQICIPSMSQSNTALVNGSDRLIYPITLTLEEV